MINFIFNESKRARNISISILSSKQIKLTIPYRLRSQKEVILQKILNEKKNWINKQLIKFKNHEAKKLYFPDKIEVDGKILTGTKLKHWAKQKIVYKATIMAEKLNFKINKIYIRDQRTRWGSCSSRGNLSFNYKIALLPEDLFEYIILHELMHLKHPHHQKIFWQDLAFLCANIKEKRKRLHKYSTR